MDQNIAPGKRAPDEQLQGFLQPFYRHLTHRTSPCRPPKLTYPETKCAAPHHGEK